MQPYLWWLLVHITFYLSIIQSTLNYASSAYFHCLYTNTYNEILTTNRICMRRIFGLHRCTYFNFVLQKYNLYSIENGANLKLFCFRSTLPELANELFNYPFLTPRSEASYESCYSWPSKLRSCSPRSFYQDGLTSIFFWRQNGGTRFQLNVVRLHLSLNLYHAEKHSFGPL